MTHLFIAFAILTVCVVVYATIRKREDDESVRTDFTKNLRVGPKIPSPANNGIPLLCPTCKYLIDQYGHCKCQAAGLVDEQADKLMAEMRRKPVKEKKYRSIDDDWSV